MSKFFSVSYLALNMDSHNNNMYIHVFIMHGRVPYIHISVCVCVFVCLCVCVCVFTIAFICVVMCVHTYVHMPAYIIYHMYVCSYMWLNR